MGFKPERIGVALALEARCLQLREAFDVGAVSARIWMRRMRSTSDLACVGRWEVRGAEWKRRPAIWWARPAMARRSVAS